MGKSVGKSESGYPGPERREGPDLSENRALEIMNAFEHAHGVLDSKRLDVKARLGRWFADFLDVSYVDVDVPCNFRSFDSVAKIRDLFIEASKLNEAAVLAKVVDDSRREAVEDEFLDARAEVLADFAEIMGRSGIAFESRDIKQNEEVVFTEGHIYRIEIQGKKVLATCSGFTENGKHFHDGRSFPSGEPIFQFYRGMEFNSYGRYVGDYKIGKEYMLQEPRHDVYMEFCGYTRSGEPVMKFLKRERVVEASDECQAGLTS